MDQEFPYRWLMRAFTITVVGVLLAGVVIAIRLMHDMREPTPRPPVHVAHVAHVARAAAPHRRSRDGRVRAEPEVVAGPSAFALEQRLSSPDRMKRWEAFVAEASKRFDIPEKWIRAVIQVESAGRTMLAEGQPIVSSAGAMGLMQLMPATYRDMRAAHNLGADPFDPHDNILAGTAYLHYLRGRYGYPAMFAAYNDGPGHLDECIANAGLLPTETVLYVERITGRLEGRGALVSFTRPDGSPVMVDGGAVRSVRAALPGEYAPGVRSVITVGAVEQGVREELATAKAIILARGGSVHAKTRLATRLVLSCARNAPNADADRITCTPGVIR